MATRVPLFSGAFGRVSRRTPSVSVAAARFSSTAVGSVASYENVPVVRVLRRSVPVRSFSVREPDTAIRRPTTSMLMSFLSIPGRSSSRTYSSSVSVRSPLGVKPPAALPDQSASSSGANRSSSSGLID